MALRRFRALEDKFAKFPATKDSYLKFMQEYIQLDHMSEDHSSDRFETGFFLPYHAVVNKDSLTTKTFLFLYHILRNFFHNIFKNLPVFQNYVNVDK